MVQKPFVGQPSFLPRVVHGLLVGALVLCFLSNRGRGYLAKYGIMIEQLLVTRAPPSLGFAYTGQSVLGTAGFASCDDAFGPFTFGCRNARLDFTLFFEQAIFTIIPSALFIIAAIVSIFQLWGLKPKVHATFIYYMKMVSHNARVY